MAANPILKEMYDNPSYVLWMKISVPVGGVIHIVLLAAGIGLLLLQNWARIVSIGYGIYAIVGGLVGGVVMMKIIMPIMQHTSGGAQGMIAMITLFSSVVGMMLGLVYPILLLIFMTRPKVVAAFRPEPAAAV